MGTAEGPGPPPEPGRRGVLGRLFGAVLAGGLAFIISLIAAAIVGRGAGSFFDYFGTTRERYLLRLDQIGSYGAVAIGLVVAVLFAFGLYPRNRRGVTPVRSESDGRAEFWNDWWVRANVAGAVAVAVAAALGYGHLYVGFLKHTSLAPLAPIVGLPLAVYASYRWKKEGRDALAVWAGCAAVLILFAANAAMIDAHQLHYANCWKIRGNDASSVWECAPGRSEPDQWPSSYDPNSDTESPGNHCDFLNTSSSGGTIWHCTQ